VEANHGQLTVRSIPRSGCIFTISLPKHGVDAPTRSVAGTAWQRGSCRPGRLPVLLSPGARWRHGAWATQP